MAFTVQKFGRATNVDAGVDTDIWDGANATDDVDIWVAPTQARTHDIASTSANDDGDPAGTGAHSIMLYGLTDWDTPEVSETVTLNGTSNVATVNSYVIIHRMVVTSFGSAGPNVGVITATAQTDATVTAQINVGEGQTQMAIYGVPSVRSARVYGYYASAIKGSSSLGVAIKLLLNPIPDEQIAGFLVKHTQGLTTEGSNYLKHQFNPFFDFSGPAIVKLQANSSANDADVSGGFDLELIGG